jgi:pyruvate kinase
MSSVEPPDPDDPLDPVHLASLRARLLELRRSALAVERTAEDELALVHADRRVGARNLVDYLALRQEDLRGLQRDLLAVGLSSLGTVQGHVMASINGGIRLLDRLGGLDSGVADSPLHPALEADRDRLDAFADDTLGAALEPGLVRVMVTMPSEAGDDPSIVQSLLEQGMTVMRINCAHDGPGVWQRMIDHLHAAQQAHHRPCRVAFDLAGPKLRTGPVAEGPEVVRCRPERDGLGRTVSPAVVRFGPALAVDGDGEAIVLPIDASLHRQAQAGDELHLEDARGRRRVFSIVAVDDAGLEGCSDRTAYLTSGLQVELRRDGAPVASGAIGRVPPTEGAIELGPGDLLVITRDLAPGRSAVVGEDDGTILEPATIGCSLPQVFESVQAGHRVMIDDGKFEGIVRNVARDRFVIEIGRAGRGRAALRAEKGINLPDTPLDLPALTAKDIEDLEFMAQRADLVSLSFVHRAEDIDELYRHLDRLGASGLGVILKIENRAAFERLPELLLTAARRRRIAVMVARGDLGVEIGFARLAEVQEQMLWLCEAAQVPVIWATQVLDSLAKNGLPSRGEVTDAAMSIRAECVMLNKGPYIGQALEFLGDVSRRMTQHANKSFATHRALGVAAAGTAWLEVDRSRASARHA